MKHYPIDPGSPAAVAGIKQRLTEGGDNFDYKGRLTHVTNDLLERVKEAAVEEFVGKLTTGDALLAATHYQHPLWNAYSQPARMEALLDSLKAIKAAIEEARK